MQRDWQQYYDEGVPRTLEYPDTTLYGMLQDAVRLQPKRDATLFFGARQRFRDLGQRVEHFASALHRMGVRRGDRVALILPNLPLYPVAHFAVMRLGAVLVPTNPLYVERELEYQLNDAGAETVVVLDQLYPRVAKVRDSTAVKRIIVAGVKEFLPRVLGVLYGIKNRSSQVRIEEGNGVFLYRKVMKRRHPPAPEVELKPDQVAIFLYTGGTTGISKGAVLTHRNLVVNVLQTRAWLRGYQDAKEVILCALPFFHSYGMTTALHLAVQSQATMVLLPRFELAEALKRIRKHRPTTFCAVPSMYNAINHSPQVKPQDVNSIRLCVSGGAALPLDVQTRFEELTGGKLVEGYGLSETSPVAIANPVFGRRKTGTIGVPICDTDARVVDADTAKPLDPGAVGELVIKGPQVMKEYWNKPEESRHVLRDGWLHTGDLAVQDEDGYFAIVDRKKDMIVSAGFNIYPREIEEVLTRHPKVVEAAVVGIPSRVREEVVKAYLVVKEGEELTRAEVMQYCRKELAKYKMPKQIEFCEELPKSSIGKILKRVLLDQERRKSQKRDRGTPA